MQPASAYPSIWTHLHTIPPRSLHPCEERKCPSVRAEPWVQRAGQLILPHCPQHIQAPPRNPQPLSPKSHSLWVCDVRGSGLLPAKPRFPLDGAVSVPCALSRKVSLRCCRGSPCPGQQWPACLQGVLPPACCPPHRTLFPFHFFFSFPPEFGWVPGGLELCCLHRVPQTLC